MRDSVAEATLDLRGQVVSREAWDGVRTTLTPDPGGLLDLEALQLDGAELPEGADFSGARLGGAGKLAGFHAESVVDFSDCRFAPDVEVSWTGSPVVLFSRARFEGRVWLSLAGGWLILDDVVFGGRMVISSSGRRGKGQGPVLLSLEGVDGDGLTVTGLDLTACHFLGASNLDAARLESWPLLDHGRPRLALRTRQMLAEELLMREAAGGVWRGLNPPDPVPATVDLPPASQVRSRGLRRDWHRLWLDGRRGAKEREATLLPEIAAVYRGLRLGQEKSGDTPAANDLYFGEMVMRRIAARRRGWERNGYLVWTLISLYQGLTGFGLRPLRPAILLLCVLAASTALLVATAGLGSESSDLTAALVYSARSMVLLPDPASVTPQRLAEALQVALRVLGPLLLGSVALCVRVRTKR